MRILLFFLLLLPLSSTAQFTSVFTCVFVNACEETDPKTPPSVKIYPNPTQDFVMVEGLAKNTEGVVFDAVGRPLKAVRIERDYLDLSDVPIGLCILRLADGRTFKIVKI